MLQEVFRRKPNNYKTFKLFIYLFSPIIITLDLLIFLYLLFNHSSDELIVLILLGLGIMFGIPFVIHVGGNQLKSKKSYNEMIKPILILNETHLIYNFNDRELYSIPWTSITEVTKDNNIERFQNRMGNIMIYCDDAYAKYIKNIKKDAYINDRNEALLISVMYVDSDYKELYNKIVDFYHKYNQ